MKKRILSMALIVAMVVAMIPAVLVNAFAAPYSGYGNGYDVYVSETDPTLDGQMDAVYANSEKIVNTHTHTAGASFRTWVVATANGIYFYAEVKDGTIDVTGEAAAAIGTGDKAQVYLQVVNGTLYDGRYFDFDYAHATSAQSKGSAKSTVTADGYTIEISIPWSSFTAITNTISLDTLKVYLGFQVNNYTLSGTNTGLVVDNPGTMAYYNSSYCNWGNNSTTAFSSYMIPVNFTTTAYTAPDTNSYTSFITNETITLDGKRDDIYLASEKITAGHVAVGTVGETTGFETYMVAREDGLYVFASMYDDTLDKADAAANGLRIQDGDKFQLFLEVGNNVWNRWGYIDFDYVNGGRNIVTPKSSNAYDNTNKSTYTSTLIQQKAVLWENEKGWDIEIFIPNAFCVDIRQGGSQSLKDLKSRINVQALNETCTAWDANGTCTARNRYGLSYDVAGAQESWGNNKHYVPVDFSVNPVSQPGTGMLTYASSVTIDGDKDAAYGDDSVAFILNKERTDSFTVNNGNEYAKAWITVTDTQIALYALVNDTTLAETPSDAVVMYVYFPHTKTCVYFGSGYARSEHIETTARWSDNIFHSTNGDETSKTASIGESYKQKALGDGWYSVEFAFNLPTAERYYLAQGETLNLGIGIQHRDRDTSNSDNIHYNRSGYESYWTDASYAHNSLPRFEVSKNSTAANFAAVKTPAITGANVALGESITVNYYANVPAYSDNVSMKFTMNGKVSFVQGVAANVAGTEYKFAFEGIAPQCMGDDIKAELYIGGHKVAEKAEYSVLTNVNNVKNADNTALIEALLHYGAAAQQYAHYKTDSLVNAGLTVPTYAETLANDQKSVTASTVDGAKFSAAGVYHANTNKLYAKITVNSASLVDKLTVTINGAEANIEKYSDGVYIVYSDDISVKDFDKLYTFVLTGESGSQTITYSVNAYAAVKWNDENAYTQTLARAMYAYGAAAENYNG